MEASCLAGEYLTAWFIDLNRSRDTIIVAGLGGGGSFPKPLNWREIESWSNLFRIHPTRWELRTLTAMDNAWLAAKNGAAGGNQYQDIGEYCGGKDVEQCRKMFGEQLEKVCSTCPE